MKKNLINGEWVDGNESINVNPSDTNDIIGEFASATQEQAGMAAESAQIAFNSWQYSTPLERHAVLKKTSHELIKRSSELGELLSREEGKTLVEGIAEVNRAGQIFDFFAGEALRLTGETGLSTRPFVNVDVTREPVGVIGIITPWNFPIAIPAWKIAPALTFGNCVVFKPASLVNASAWALVDILQRSGLPDGVLNLVMGSGRVVGQNIVESPNINAITFTGSSKTGKDIANFAAKTLTKVQLEMGGKNPLVVLDDADLELAVDCALDGSYFSTGQRCTASSRLIVTENIHDKFVLSLKKKLENISVGHALKKGVHIGPVADESQLKQNESYLKIAHLEDAKIETGGVRLKRGTPGYFQQPALLTECNNDMRVCREEIFGPIAAVIKVKNYDEALFAANDTIYGLTSGICTNNLKYASDFKRKSEAGMVMVNLPTAGVDFHVPFGGRKASSYGPREQGSYARDFYTTIKTAYVNA